MSQKLRGGTNAGPILSNDFADGVPKRKAKRKEKHKWRDEEAVTPPSPPTPSEQVEPSSPNVEIPERQEETQPADVTDAVAETVRDRTYKAGWAVALWFPLLVSASVLISRANIAWACGSWLISLLFAWPLRKTVSTALNGVLVTRLWLKVAVTFALLGSVIVTAVCGHEQVAFFLLIALVTTHSLQLTVIDLQVASTQITVIDLEENS